MKKNKNKLAFPVLSIFIALGISKMASAAVPTIDITKLENLTIPDAINLISTAIIGIIAFVSVLFLIIGGFRYITAAGNPEQMQGSKNTIMYAIIGLVAALLSFAIVQYVLTSLHVG